MKPTTYRNRTVLLYSAVALVGLAILGLVTASGARTIDLVGAAFCLCGLLPVVKTDDNSISIRNLFRHRIPWSEVAEVEMVFSYRYLGRVLQVTRSDGRKIRSWAICVGRGGLGADAVEQNANAIILDWRRQ